MARVLGVPAGPIMSIDPHQIEVLRSSATDGNPHHKGQRADLNNRFYCEAVMKERAPLLVPAALKDPEWDDNPAIKLGMTFYFVLRERQIDTVLLESEDRSWGNMGSELRTDERR